MKARYLVAAASLLPALLLPAGASAATAGVGDFGGQMTAHYHAGPGEVNNVTVTASNGAVTFSDPGISMAPSPGFEGTFCTTPGTNTITCSHPDGIEYLEIQVKGGADKVNNSTSIGSQIYGGDQDDPDVLTGGSGNDAISDQGGADKLIGHGGSDELSGG